jgi:hypothetical protein
MLRAMRILALLLIAACHATPAATTPCPAAPSSAAAIPGEDAALVKWKAIAATADKAPPKGTSAASLVPELVDYLGSTDPIRRDSIAYEVLAAWLAKGVLVDADVHALTATLSATLDGPLDAPNSVFGRSFSALVLGEVVRRDRKTPVLTDGERRALLASALTYAQRETDLRGHTGAMGWAHAAAHTADLLARLAQLPSFADADRAVVLDAVAAFVVRRHGEIFAYGEDGRLAVAVVSAAKAGLAADAIDRWLAALKAPLVEANTPVFNPGLFAAQRNVRNLLFTLFVHGSTTADPTPGEKLLFEKVRALLVE